MTVIIYWFRNDLRLTDNPAFTQACLEADYLLPIYLHQPEEKNKTSWGFKRVTGHRKTFLQESLHALRAQLQNLGSDLFELSGELIAVFSMLKETLGISLIYCEQIEAPEELAQTLALKSLGFEMRQRWQSSMLEPQDFPFDLQQMPDIFTQFRQQIEKQGLKFANPVEAPVRIPALPDAGDLITENFKSGINEANPAYTDNSCSENIFTANRFKGGERQALLHLAQYFQRRLPDTYKQTRNQLIGLDYSSKFSPWLAAGCCSARTIAQYLNQYESQYGANDGTYWLWFELLWRDYFRFLHFKYGKKLYRFKGLSDKPVNQFDAEIFYKWCSGETGQSLVDAGMRELRQTGYLSNRMRQIVASYLIYDLEGDWQAGAAWFESQLIDYDVYSNQGNWLYIAGRGTDPRGGRAFNVAKQTHDHDPEGVYRSLWG